MINHEEIAKVINSLLHKTELGIGSIGDGTEHFYFYLKTEMRSWQLLPKEVIRVFSKLIKEKCIQIISIDKSSEYINLTLDRSMRENSPLVLKINDKELLRYRQSIISRYKENTDIVTVSIPNLMKAAFDSKTGMIRAGGKNCHIPSNTNQFTLCSYLFAKSKDELVDWSEIYQDITGNYRGLPNKNKWRVVYDAMEAVNKKFNDSSGTDQKLFSWENKSVKRNL